MHDSITDSLIKILITDTITQNDLKGRSLWYQLLKPVEQCTDYIYQNNTSLPRFKLFASGFITGPKNTSAGFMLSGLSKKESIYSFGYNPFQKQFIFSYGVKLHL